MPTDPSSNLSENDLDYGDTLRGLRAGLKVFGRYEIIRMLGRGGMGVVWLARDTKLDLEMALKFLPENLVHDEVALDDLRRETKRCMKLTHQHIVHVFDFVSDESTAAIAMEYVDGKSLSALRLEQPGKVFDVAQLAPMLEQVCEALTYAHEHGRLVHYDLKPGNLMLTSGGLVKVMDFGIAASINDSNSRQSRARSTAGMGTLHYMSPQQLAGYPPGVGDDVYSLGATLYELLTGRPPFQGFRDRALEVQINTAVPPSMAQRRAELTVEGAAAMPPLWEQVVSACLEKDLDKRPQSVADVWQRLSGMPVKRVHKKPAETQPSGKIVEPKLSETSAKKPVLAALAAALCFGSTAAWWFGIEAPKLAEAARIEHNEQQRRDQELADARESERLAVERANAATARIAKEMADLEEKQRLMAAQAESARLAMEKAAAEEKARVLAAETERRRTAALESERKQKEAAMVPAPPPPKPPAADIKLIAYYDCSSQLHAMSTLSEGTIHYHPRYAFDGDKNTSWVEGVEGTGAGEWVSAEFSRTVTLSAVSILPGYGKNADIFKKNGRVKKLEMILDGSYSLKLSFDDTAQSHHFNLPAPMTVRTVKFRILEALHGTKYDDTAISDIRFE